MTTVQRTAISLAGLVLTIASISACNPKPAALTEKEARYIETLIKKMTMRCFGRYLVDVPEDMVLNTEGLQKIDGVTIEVRPMSRARFESVLAARKTELENTLMVAEERHPLLRKAIRLPHDGQGFIFDRAWSDVSGGRLNRMLELMAWKDGYRVLTTIKAIDTTFPEDANDPTIQKNMTTDVPEKLAQLLNVFHRVKGRPDHEIPTEQGVCILNGFVSGPPTNQEDAGVVFHLKTADDVYFSFGTDSGITESDSLLDRVKAVEPVIQQGDGRVLRKGRREVNGIKGEELMYTIRGDDGLLKVNPMTHRFVFEANSRIGSAKTPIIVVDFYNGVRKPEPPRKERDNSPPPITNATLSQAEAMALWDAVIPTIRPRPGAF